MDEISVELNSVTGLWMDRLNLDAGDNSARDKTEIDVVEYVQRLESLRNHESSVESQLLVDLKIHFIIFDIDYLRLHQTTPVSISLSRQ